MKPREENFMFYVMFFLIFITRCLAQDPAKGLKEVFYSRLGKENSGAQKGGVAITEDYKKMLEDPTQVLITINNNNDSRKYLYISWMDALEAGTIWARKNTDDYIFVNERNGKEKIRGVFSKNKPKMPATPTSDYIEMLKDPSKVILTTEFKPNDLRDSEHFVRILNDTELNQRRPIYAEQFDVEGLDDTQRLHNLIHDKNQKMVEYLTKIRERSPNLSEKERSTIFKIENYVQLLESKKPLLINYLSDVESISELRGLLSIFGKKEENSTNVENNKPVPQSSESDPENGTNVLKIPKPDILIKKGKALFLDPKPLLDKKSDSASTENEVSSSKSLKNDSESNSEVQISESKSVVKELIAKGKEVKKKTENIGEDKISLIYEFLQELTEFENKLVIEKNLPNFKDELNALIQNIEEKLLLGVELPKEFSKKIYILKQSMKESNDVSNVISIIKDLKSLAKGFFEKNKKDMGSVQSRFRNLRELIDTNLDDQVLKVKESFNSYDTERLRFFAKSMKAIADAGEAEKLSKQDIKDEVDNNLKTNMSEEQVAATISQNSVESSEADSNVESTSETEAQGIKQSFTGNSSLTKNTSEGTEPESQAQADQAAPNSEVEADNESLEDDTNEGQEADEDSQADSQTEAGDSSQGGSLLKQNSVVNPGGKDSQIQGGPEANLQSGAEGKDSKNGEKADAELYKENNSGSVTQSQAETSNENQLEPAQGEVSNEESPEAGSQIENNSGDQQQANPLSHSPIEKIPNNIQEQNEEYTEQGTTETIAAKIIGNQLVMDYEPGKVEDGSVEIGKKFTSSLEELDNAQNEAIIVD